MPVDLSASVYAQYKQARKRAEEAIRAGSAGEGAVEHRRAAGLMRQYAGYTHDSGIKQQRLQRAAMHDKMAGQLADMPSSMTPGRRGEAVKAAETAGDTDYESDALALIEHSAIRWDDIGGLQDTKEAIREAFGLAMARKPQGVRIDSLKNLLLFGPPGTGKTLLAAATAGSLDATFFNVTVSKVLSKYFGESTKILAALFAVARRLSPSVIFLDEFESLAPPRGDADSGAERRLTGTFLAELDGLATKSDENYVLTIGATNVPWLLDEALLSRFQKRILVPLPDAEARLSILDIHLIRRGHKIEIPIAALAQRTAGFSGREIEMICQTAIANMTRRANPNLMAVVDQGQAALREYEIRVEAVSEDDFDGAFAHFRPAADAASLKRYQEWLTKSEA